jgi:membrane-bound lytic murein transglycosylase B
LARALLVIEEDRSTADRCLPRHAARAQGTSPGAPPVIYAGRMRRATAIFCAMVCAGCTSPRGSAPESGSSISPSHALVSSSTPRPTAGPSSATHPSAHIPAGADDPAVVPAISNDPAMLGRQLVAAERAVRASGTSRSRLRAAARTTQVAYGRLGQHPGWSATVLQLVPAWLRGTVVANLRARRELRAIPNSAPQDLMPAWRIQAPVPAGQLLTWYHTAGARFGVGWQYLAAVNLIETTFGKVHGLSAAGAQGPMQFLPSTWEEYGAGGDVNDPHDAIFAAARYLADRGFARGDVAGALYAYNPTMHYVNAVKAIASVLAADPRSFAGYYRWDVYYPTSSGVLLLPRGFAQHHRTSAAEYARAHPERVLH